MNAFRKKLATIERGIDKLDAKKRALCHDAQLACEHTDVVECPFHENKFIRSYPPFRVCIACGFAELGWNCGNQILGYGELSTVSRDQAEALRLGPLHPNGDFVRVGEERNKKKLYRMALKKAWGAE